MNCACPQCSGSLESTDPEDKIHGFMMCDDTELEIDMKFAFSAWETMEEWDFEQGWMLEEST